MPVSICMQNFTYMYTYTHKKSKEVRENKCLNTAKASPHAC